MEYKFNPQELDRLLADIRFAQIEHAKQISRCCQTLSELQVAMQARARLEAKMTMTPSVIVDGVWGSD